MRSLPLLAATTVILAVATGCGDNGQGIDPPVANFTQTCTELSCTFTDASTGDITAWAWDFGDPNSGANNTSNLENPVHTFSAPNTAPGYSVRLTVTDRSGTTNTITKPVTVSGGTTGGTPTASFDAPVCTGLSCSFHSTSTDVAPGTIVSINWNFGDLNSGANNTATGIDATHVFSAAGQYTVTLTVTDNEGLTGTTSQTITVTAPTGQACTSTGTTEITCTITLTQRSTVMITLESEDCEIGNNNVLIPPPEPRAQAVFFNVCNLPTPQQYTLVDQAGANLVFEAGTQLPIVFRRGADPVAGPPQAQFTVNGANSWTIDIDDGGNPGGPGEPDFADAVLTVTATAAP
jgi:PKD repeat protein